MSAGANHALRHGVALSRMDHVHCVGVYGLDALDVIDRLIPRDLFLRDGMATQSLLLNEDATVFADVTVVADDEDFLLLCEGPERAALLDVARAAVGEGEEAEVRDLSQRWGVLSVSGPYAWELMSVYAGPEIVGLPYLHAVSLEDVICLRAGKTGEYGYDLLVPHDSVEAVSARLMALGAAFDIEEAGLDDLDAAAWENFFYSPRSEGLKGLNPAQLQLRWRATPGRTGYRGAAALNPLLEAPTTERLTCALPESALPLGAVLRLEGRPVGRVVHTGEAPTLGAPLVYALLETSVSHPGVILDADGQRVRTVTPPVIRNRSLFVDRQRHRYQTRADDKLPALT